MMSKAIISLPAFAISEQRTIPSVLIAFLTSTLLQILVAVTAHSQMGRVELSPKFTLIDTSGQFVTHETYAGKFVMAYFGYTFCPDVCPTDLMVMATALEEMDDDLGAHIQPLFISLDPQRDTPEVLTEYVKLFHPGLKGLTGTKKQIKDTAAAFTMRYKFYLDGSMREYSIDHISYIYVLDRKGKMIDFFPSGTPPRKVADAMKKLILKDLENETRESS